MKCPYCKHPEQKTLETRECPDNTTRRRKECLKCQRRFTTYEHIEITPIKVIKKDGKKQPFDKEKLIAGIKKACEKREVAEFEILKITDEIEQKVESFKEVTTRKIGMYVLNRLKKLDKIAYMRFASVYRDFEDIEHFESELSKLHDVKKNG